MPFFLFYNILTFSLIVYLTHIFIFRSVLPPPLFDKSNINKLQQCLFLQYLNFFSNCVFNTYFYIQVNVHDTKHMFYLHHHLTYMKMFLNNTFLCTIRSRPCSRFPDSISYIHRPGWPSVFFFYFPFWPFSSFPRYLFRNLSEIK